MGRTVVGYGGDRHQRIDAVILNVVLSVGKVSATRCISFDFPSFNSRWMEKHMRIRIDVQRRLRSAEGTKSNDTNIWEL